MRKSPFLRTPFPRFAAHLALVLLAALAGAASVQASPAYPVKASANNRYLVDQNNEPFLMVGDSPQALIVNLSEAEAAGFFANRSAHGFNTMWINLLCTTYTRGRADASMLDGTKPFTANVPSTSYYDLTTPNEAYFAHVDRIVTLAGQYGIQIMFIPIETGGFIPTLLANGTTRCRTYGQYLGNRYRNFDNIVWMSGNDFQTWTTPAHDAVVRQVALGILDNDTRHMQTLELQYFESSSLDNPNWTSNVNLNAAYTYFPTYARLRSDYGRAAFRPTFMVEANYEFENLAGPVTTPQTLRKQAYWTMTSGVTGQLYGNGYTWGFVTGWQTHLDTPGAAQMSILRAFFQARAWYGLVPDTTHVVVTSGYGTYSRTGYVVNNDYLTAARTADGKLVVVYTPIVRTFVVDMTKLSAAASTRWFDPSRGTYAAIAGSPFANTGTRSFTPPGNNGDGDGGWVLVLETNPPETVPPVVALTAPTPNGTVEDSVTVSATASDNVGVIGVQFTVDGVNLGAERTSPPYTAGWNTALMTAGPHVLRAIARDLVNNRAMDSLTVTVVHDVLPPPTDHLAAAYAFDEGTGATTADGSGNGNTMTIHGATFGSGVHGTALNFNGLSNYLEAPNSASLDIGGGGLSIAFWAKITDNPGGPDMVLLGKPWSATSMPSPFYQYGIEYSSITSKTLSFYFGDPSSNIHGPFYTSPRLGAWTHVAFTYDGATVRGYLDGVEVLSVLSAGSIAPRGNSLRAGADGAYQQFFKGALDDVRIYNRVLSGAEIASTMQTPVPGPTTGIGDAAATASVALFTGVPNPFRSGTRIGFALPASGVADVRVYDATGRLVRVLANSTYAPGRHTLEWDGADGTGRPVQPGRYFVRLRAGATAKSVGIVRLR